MDVSYLISGSVKEPPYSEKIQFTEYVTGDHAKHSILALCEEFDDDLIVVLDGAPYLNLLRTAYYID